MQAMTKPDRTLIAEVMLFSQGFSSAGKLSEKLVPLFKLCQEQLSPQSHYDFTLRALKSVLVSAGNVKRLKMKGERRGNPPLPARLLLTSTYLIHLVMSKGGAAKA